MTELRRNEFKDLLEMNEIIFIEHPHFIQSNISKIGNINYYPKSDKLQIHKTNKWELDGFNFIKTHLKKINENLFTEKEVIDLLEHVRQNYYDTGTLWHQEPYKDFTSKEIVENFKNK